MKPKTYWKPIAIKTLLAMGFPDFTDHYHKPTFIKVKRDGTKDKREIVAVGCENLPENCEVILEDYMHLPEGTTYQPPLIKEDKGMLEKAKSIV